MAEVDLRPNVSAVLAASVVITLVSTVSLSWPAAIASIVLGVLAFTGADVDARTHHLPDTVTLGAAICGIVAAAALDPNDPRTSALLAVARAFGTAGTLAFVRQCYSRLRGHEGLGFGDVKLAAAVGAWLPLDAIPLCFLLATTGALLAVLLGALRGQSIESRIRLPFGAFLCPALWLAFYAGALLE
jgi:leader peptidase (prepilin peptidase)/N-methyltransferase